MYSISFNFTMIFLGTYWDTAILMYCFHLTNRKTEAQNGEELAQAYPAGKWQSRASNPSSPPPDPTPLPLGYAN